MRAENPPGGDSVETLSTAWQTTSRQYEKRSRAWIVSVDQQSTFSTDASRSGRSIELCFALSTNVIALLPKSS